MLDHLVIWVSQVPTDFSNLDLNLLFQLLDRIPNVDPLLANLESYVVSEGLMVMRANSDTITTVSIAQPRLALDGPKLN